MLQKLKLFSILALISMISIVAVCDSAEASGRTGSHRYGGYNSHGKGSHYYGGHTMRTDGSFQVAQHRCRDGSYSNSTGSGTCSHHGGEDEA
jgi:hypothetical protein